jgi:hypothetical protein
MLGTFRGLKGIAVALLFCLVCATALARDYQIISVAAGDTADVYFEINLAGKVYLRIVAPPGSEPCANFWWIKWPFGNVEEVGRICGGTQIDVPGLTHFAISAKLRVRAGSNSLKVVAAANERVANSVSVPLP